MEVSNAMEENGRRKGKFNIVDIVVLAIVALGIFLVGAKFLSGGDTPADVGGVPVRYTVLVRSVDARVCDNIMPYKDDNVQLMANGELVNGFVVGIEQMPHLNYGTNQAGYIIPTEETGENARFDLLFTIEAKASNRVNYKVGTQEVRIGKGHIVKTTIFELEGYSTTILSRDDMAEFDPANYAVVADVTA